MNSRLLRRLNGSYQKLKRNRHLIAKELSLSHIEFRFWDLCIASYDWDSRHTETFGTIDFTDRDLASILCCSASTVNRARSKLVDKGLLEKLDKGWRVKQEMPILVNAQMRQDVAPAKQGFASVTQDHAPMRQNQGLVEDSSLVSYKSKFSFGMSGRGGVKETEESDKDSFLIRSQFGRALREVTTSLSLDDIDWINNDLERRGYGKPI